MTQPYTQQPQEATSALRSDSKKPITDENLSLKEINFSTPNNNFSSEKYSKCVSLKGNAIKTGIASVLKISGYTKPPKQPETNLHSSIRRLVKVLNWAALLFAVLISILSSLRGLLPNPLEVVMYFLALLFILLPEKLPKLVTAVLSEGSRTMYSKGVILKNLNTAETLGNVSVIVTDKIGVLTENKPHITHLFFDGDIKSIEEFKTNEKSALKTAFLASAPAGTADLSDPFAKALFDYLKKAGLDTKTLKDEWIVKDEISFDLKREIASYLYQFNNSKVVLSSGSHQRIIEKSNRILLEGRETPITDSLRTQFSNITKHMELNGESLHAFGYHRLSTENENNKELWESDFVLVGIIGFTYSPRKEVKDAIQSGKQAGVRVILLDRDNPEVARTFADKVGLEYSRVVSGKELFDLSDYDLKKMLEETPLFARVNPEDKFRIVKLLKEKDVVAVTGYDVKDVPSLKEAHIGIVPSLSVTELVKESSNIRLSNYSFASIGTAVREGRRLFGNINKGLQYYLACKLAIVALFVISLILSVPLPFLPIHIILFELSIFVVTYAISIAEPQEQTLTKKSSYYFKERFMDNIMLKNIFLGAFSIFLTVTLVYLFAYYTSLDIAYARTASLAAWLLSHLLLAFNFCSGKQSLFKHGLLSNKLIVIWALLVASILLLSSTLPLLQTVLNMAVLQPLDWIFIVILSFFPTFWVELRKKLTKKL
ncbi:MAG: cation-transporting P-type ATPase [Crenarchaeota archaeon]|nr:cation-transporting P-type ATPase [Thermoproteota archaeon]